MKKFYTKFDIAPYSGVVMNPYDAVDRLSYMDSTQQIVSFMRAGVNMKLQRSQMLIDSTDVDGASFNAPSIPVYAPDISEAYKQLHKMQDDLKENQRILTEKMEKVKADSVVSPEKGADSDLPSAT